MDDGAPFNLILCLLLLMFISNVFLMIKTKENQFQISRLELIIVEEDWKL